MSPVLAAGAPGGPYAGRPSFGLGVPAQARLAIGQANDPYEREADGVAEAVTAGQPAPVISRLPAGGLSRLPQLQVAEDKPDQAVAVQRQGEEEEQEPVQEWAIQRQGEEEEPVQAVAVQRQGEEEEPVQEWAIQRQTAEAEEPDQAVAVQRQAAEAEEPDQAVAIQRQGEEEEPVQEWAIQRLAEEEEEPVQAETRSGGGPASASMAGAAARAIRHPGGGQPLEPTTRGVLESSLGADLSRVRVHQDGPARETARALQARAFTHQNNIWLGPGESQQDLGLMAHEAAHVVQQTGGVRRQVIQRAKKSAAAGGPKTKYSKRGSSIDTSAKIIEIAQLRVPRVKARRMNKAERIWKQEERDTAQRKLWDDDVKSDSDAEVERALAKGAAVPVDGQEWYYLKSRRRNFYLMGTMTTIKARARRPTWDETGAEHAFDVDHIQEDQMNGPDRPDNFWMWDASANRSSGPRIDAEIKSRLANLLEEAQPTLLANTPSFEKVQQDYTVKFPSVRGTLKISGDQDAFWESADIKKGKHLEPLRVLKKDKEIDEVRGQPTALVIYTAATGGRRFDIKPWNPKESSVTGNYPFFDNFTGQKITYSDGKGTVTGIAFKDNRWIKEKPLEITLRQKPGIAYGGYIHSQILASMINKLEFKKASPIELQQMELLPEIGLAARGKLLPTLSIFQGVGIDILIAGNEIELSKQFTADDFSLPRPIKVTESSMLLTAGTRGLSLDGSISFEIERVGSGRLAGFASEKKGLGLKGSFDFDTDLFDPASIELSYIEGVWSVKGTLGVKKGKIRGVKSALVTVGLEDGQFMVDGAAELDIPKTKDASLAIKYSEATGLVMCGAFALADDVPGVASSSFAACIVQNPEGGGYKITATGTVKPKVPGLDSAAITAAYDNGLFVVEASLAYKSKSGLLSGQFKFGLTNRAVDEAGQLTGEPGDRLIVYGEGCVDVNFARVLKGTICGKISPAGQVIISGAISLPDKVNLTDKAFEIGPKELFKFPDIEIPIIGVKALGKKVGIFAIFGGDLSFYAKLGPLQLGLKVEVNDYNPEDEDSLAIKGKADLSIPAYAYLKLGIFGGIEGSILIVEARVTANVDAFLIAQGEAGAEVGLKWSKLGGLELLGAEGHLKLMTKLLLELSAQVKVTLDLLFKTITLYQNKWKLASKEFGGGLLFGIHFPVKIENGEFKGLDFKDMTLDKPEFGKDTTKNLLTGAVEEAKDDRKPAPSREEMEKHIRSLPDTDARYGYFWDLLTKYKGITANDLAFAARLIKQLEREELAARIKAMPPEKAKQYIMALKLINPGTDYSYLEAAVASPSLEA